MYPVWPIWLASTIPAAAWLQPKLLVLKLQDVLTLFCYHWVVICLTLILRYLTALKQEARSLGLRLSQEVERKEENKRSKKRIWRRKLTQNFFSQHPWSPK